MFTTLKNLETDALEIYQTLEFSESTSVTVLDATHHVIRSLSTHLPEREYHIEMRKLVLNPDGSRAEFILWDGTPIVPYKGKTPINTFHKPVVNKLPIIMEHTVPVGNPFDPNKPNEFRITHSTAFDTEKECKAFMESLKEYASKELAYFIEHCYVGASREEYDEEEGPKLLPNSIHLSEYMESMVEVTYPSDSEYVEAIIKDFSEAQYIILPDGTKFKKV